MSDDGTCTIIACERERGHDGLHRRTEPVVHWRPWSARTCSRPRCNVAAVAELSRYFTRRGIRREAWYAYCPAHLTGYGRHVEDGAVVFEWEAAAPVSADREGG